MQATQPQTTDSRQSPAPPPVPPPARLPAPPPAPPPVGMQPLAPPPSPPHRTPPSPLGRLMLWVLVLALGVLVLIDVAGVGVAASVYFAVLLALTGGGLLLAGFYGRARWLIGLGIFLSIGLAISAAVEGVRLGGPNGSVTWKPSGIEQLEGTYEISIGNAVLDLSDVDFAGRSESIDVRVDVGDLDIILPPDVDADIVASVDVGNARVFGQQWSGIGQPQRSVSDDGTDGPGGGEVVIRATVDVGDLEVRR